MMKGIANFTIEQFRAQVSRFDPKYVQDWNQWCRSLGREEYIAVELGRVLRRWQACRPNRMRRTINDGCHEAPFLEDLIHRSRPHVLALNEFDIASSESFTSEATSALRCLWVIFQDLSYYGKARKGKAGAVGISKATLLLTEGRVGPALDSNVRRHLGIKEPKDAAQWILALRQVSRDIRLFELKNRTTLKESAPCEFRDVHNGRIYDMALGPG